MAKDRMDREERKQLRGPDEFVTTATSIVEWAQANLKTVIMVAAALVAVFLGVGVYNSYQNAQRREANADLAGGLDAFRGGDFTDASAALADVAKRTESAVAPIAAVVAADSALRAGDPDTAIATLSGLQQSALPPYLRQQAQVTWGNSLEAKGDLEGAAAKYAAAAANVGPYTAEALIAQARIRTRNGDTAGAADIYQKVLDEFPDRNDRLFLESRT